MSGTTRPKRVVIVDADNPLEEVHGEFFWLEDHQRIVAAEREAAYRSGVWQGVQAAKRELRPVVVRRANEILKRALATFAACLHFQPWL